MWAQLVKARLRPGVEDQLMSVNQRWEDEVGRGTDSGWLRTLSFRGADDPGQLYMIVFFESEEKARANERNPKHQEIAGQLSQFAEGQLQFVDLTPIRESTR